MEYPGSIFVRPLRLIFLSLFVAAFFIITPLVIIYTVGYRYDFKYGFLRETGGLNVDVAPKNAVVFLNNAALKNSSPFYGQTTVVNQPHMAPGNYALRISAPGFYDWQKNITISNRQTSYIKEISLLRKSDPELLIASNASTSPTSANESTQPGNNQEQISGTKSLKVLSLSDDGQWLLYGLTSKTGASTTLWLYNTAASSTQLVTTISSAEKISVSWAKKNNVAAVEWPTGRALQVLLINATNLQLIDLAASSPAPLTKFQWSDSGESRAYYSTAVNLYAYDIRNDNTIQLASRADDDWYFVNGSLWTIRYNTSTDHYEILKDSLGFPSRFSIVNTPAPMVDVGRASLNISRANLSAGQASTSTTFFKSAVWQIIFATQNTVLLKAADEAKMVILRANQEWTLATHDFTIAPLNNWWLFWNDNELWSDNENLPPQLLNRSSEIIRQVIQLDQYNTLAIVGLASTTALFPYYYVQQDLISKPTVALQVDIRNQIIYFVNDEGLWKLSY